MRKPKNLKAQRDELLAALKECVVYEQKRAGYLGLCGCTCIAASRDSEREYEMGRCPHQIALAAIAKTEPVGPEHRPSLDDLYRCRQCKSADMITDPKGYYRCVSCGHRQRPEA